MKYTQFLIFELGKTCNLAKVHKACPSASPGRFAHVDTSHMLTDEIIVRTAVRMYREFAFRGAVAFHFYNEPTLQSERMHRLMALIKDEVPAARFVLWTNGTQHVPQPIRNQFDAIHVTNYARDGHPPLAEICDSQNAEVHGWPLDARLTAKEEFSRRPCARPFTEMVFDAYGNTHPCCYDWRGLGTVGNLFADELEDIVADWVFERDSMTKHMDYLRPDVCQLCSMRPAQLHVPNFIPEIAADAKEYITELNDAPDQPVDAGRSIGVVFPSYRIPVQRLVDHFKWNDTIYRKLNASVFVVVDEKDDDASKSPEDAMPFPAAVWDLPDYVQLVHFAECDLPVVDNKPVFSITKTKNLGIDVAIESGCDLIVCTDVDVSLDAEAWAAAMRVTDYTAAVPLYKMADTFDTRIKAHVDAPNATGTVAMTAHNWDRLRYEEKCVGYGCDDGIMCWSIRHANIKIDRTGNAYHMAHSPGTPQAEFNGRGDHWNRDDGFNFKNFTGNGAVHRERVG